MPITLLSNHNYPIGNVIKQELQSANNVQIAVAFLKFSGVRVIESALRQCLDNGGNVELIAGLDFKTTDPQSIHYFVNLKKQYPKVKFYCFGDKGENKTNIVFHPKIYLFEEGRETTGIVGSTNLTHGGLISNFEVNTIFKETKPLYFSQLQAIYNSVKFTDSIFAPDEEYLAGYSDVYRAFLENEDRASRDKGLQKVIKEMQDKEEFLPGTVPSLKSLIVDAIKKKQETGQEFVPLSQIYEELEKIVEEDDNLHFKMETFRNTIRGELNHHEDEKNSSRNMHLFIRSKEQKGFYALTEKGKNYQGR